MTKRSSLREFQQNLARRLAEASTADRRGLLGFQAGSESWLIDLAEAGEIMPPPPLSIVPLTRPWFRGLANVRGALYGVVDLAQFHGEAAIVPRSCTPAVDRRQAGHSLRAAGVPFTRSAQRG